MSNWWCIQMCSRAEPSSSLGMTLSCARHQVHLHPCRSTRRPGSGPYPGQIWKRPHSSTMWILVKKQDATRMYICLNICRLITDSKTMDHRVNHTRCNIVALRDRGLGTNQVGIKRRLQWWIVRSGLRLPSNHSAMPCVGHWTWKAESLPQSTVCISMPCQFEWWVEETLNITTNVASRLFFHSKASLIKRISLANCTCSRNGHVEQSIGTAVSTLARSWNKYHLTMLQFIPRPRPNYHLKNLNIFEYLTAKE